MIIVFVNVILLCMLSVALFFPSPGFILLGFIGKVFNEADVSHCYSTVY